MVNSPDEEIFGEILRKKMKKNTWREYWVILRNDRLIFMSPSERKVAGMIKLSQETTCKVVGRKSSKHVPDHGTKPTVDHMQNGDETCKFKLYAKRGVHLLKTDCTSSCERWIEAISHVVHNLWDMNPSNNAPAAPFYNGKQSLRCRLKRDIINTWAGIFGYAALVEEDEGTVVEENIENSSGIQNAKAISPRITVTEQGTFSKWINFRNHLPRARSKPINYKLLIEDITN